jgi:hypothetical protein
MILFAEELCRMFARLSRRQKFASKASWSSEWALPLGSEVREQQEDELFDCHGFAVSSHV